MSFFLTLAKGPRIFQTISLRNRGGALLLCGGGVRTTYAGGVIFPRFVRGGDAVGYLLLDTRHKAAVVASLFKFIFGCLVCHVGTLFMDESDSFMSLLHRIKKTRKDQLFLLIVNKYNFKP